MPGVGTRDQLKDYMVGVIADIGKGFTDPDDDWMMVAVMEDADGELHLAPLDPAAFATEASKDMLAQVIKGYIAQKRIVNYVILFNVHGVAFKTQFEMDQAMKERGDRRLSSVPGAVEMLMLVVGNSAHETSFQADIIRDGENPPTLGEWKEVNGQQGRFTGFNEQMKPIEL